MHQATFLAGQQRVVGAFAIGAAPTSDGLFNEPVFAGLEKVRSGNNRAASDPVLFTGPASVPSVTL